MRALRHITKLNDEGGSFLVNVRCKCGYACWIKPKQLARRFGWGATLASLAPRMRCSKCGTKAAQVVAVAEPRPRGIPKNPH
ncbi:MAG: hypothetical protein JWO04_4732 [Gammaproteobacteria bacterium]|jgi:ssDNA-binding Zn-finger/Zn-ribbon topoisomerase 1|nr:hypothetical protein [Gammaproteobacteria bacterium]